MTNEELANHWNVSLQNVENISNIINCLYSVELIPSHNHSENSWKVVLRANDKGNHYILMEEGIKYLCKDQAIIQGTQWAQNITMTQGQAKLMEVPVDAYLSLRPIKGYEKALKRFKNSIKNKAVLNTHLHD